MSDVSLVYSSRHFIFIFIFLLKVFITIWEKLLVFILVIYCFKQIVVSHNSVGWEFGYGIAVMSGVSAGMSRNS